MMIVNIMSVFMIYQPWKIGNILNYIHYANEIIQALFCGIIFEHLQLHYNEPKSQFRVKCGQIIIVISPFYIFFLRFFLDHLGISNMAKEKCFGTSDWVMMTKMRPAVQT